MKMCDKIVAYYSIRDTYLSDHYSSALKTTTVSFKSVPTFFNGRVLYSYRLVGNSRRLEAFYVQSRTWISGFDCDN